VKRELVVDDHKYHYYSLPALNDPRVNELPFSIRVLLESALRNCDNFEVHQKDVEAILNWKTTSHADQEIPFKPARVILQDFTGVPAVVDLAAMRDAMQRLGGDADKINPLVPVDLVIDHSVQVDVFGTPDALQRNQDMEFHRNAERFEFLKWGSKALNNFRIVPPGTGIVHQVNLEYLARIVFDSQGLLYPDSLVGTDSHTTMINGLGVVGWGVGGIEAEAVMLGQSISMLLPQVVGYKLTGRLPPTSTATDLVLTITKNLRDHGVVGKFVEFFGDGVRNLSVADRATLGNMSPEYGATIGYFPVDETTIQYLLQTGRDAGRVRVIEQYLRAQGLFNEPGTREPVFSSVIELDLSTVQPCVAGPKRPHDRVLLSSMAKDFQTCLTNKVGFKGFGLASDELSKTVSFDFHGKQYQITHGSVVIAAITSCTNTSNPNVMIAAGLLCRNARAKGLKIQPYIKTSLSPGSGVVTRYFDESGLTDDLNAMGYNLCGYGCMTCIGNSGELPDEVKQVLTDNPDVVAAAVLSGNRNFEGRIHPLTRANYLASPPLVVAYALAGSVNFDFENDPLGVDHQGKQVFLRDIWPSAESIQELIATHVTSKMFREVYQHVEAGTPAWNALAAPTSQLYPWSDKSTYIHNPPFFATMGAQPGAQKDIKDAYALLFLGDSITTDHISPAGNISRTSPAARYLQSHGVKPEDFNTYGARRGNDEVMARGTFANVRLVNRLLGKAAPKTLHVPSNEVMDIFDAAMRYKTDGNEVVIIAGADYGSGSSRDWAAKGPALQGVKAVIAISYERIHRSNLVGMGIIPLQFRAGETSDTLGLTGKEQFTINITSLDLKPHAEVPVTTSTGKTFITKLRFDTPVELEYYRHGGILQFVLRQLLAKK